MAILNYFLYLVITLLLLCPFIIWTTTSIMSAYYKFKLNCAANMADSYGKAMLDAAKKMKEKENA